MNEVLQSILEFGFTNLNLLCIEAFTHRKNENSKKLLERNPFMLVTGKTDKDNKNNVIYEIKNTKNNRCNS